MKKISAILVILGNFFAVTLCNAAYFELPKLTASDIEPVFKTLSAAFSFRPVEPASDLGKAYGFYLGFSASIVDASILNSIVQLPVSYIPSGDLQGGLSFPWGLTLEAGMLPGISISGTSFSKYSAAIKWTANRVLFDTLPFNVAARFAYSNGNINYDQVLSGGNIRVSYGTSIISGNIIASKEFSVFEPFIGLGIASYSSSITGSGNVSLFGSDFPIGTTTYSASKLSFWPQIGTLIKLGFFGLGLEYDNMFGLSTYNVKFSFRF